MGGVAGILRGAVGDAGKFSMLISVGTNAVPCSTISSMVSSVEAGAVLDAIDACFDQAGSASSLKTCAVTRAPSACAASIAALHVVGPQRRQIADLTVDPVAHQLDPAVAPTGLLGDRVGQLRLVFQLDGEVALVALGPGQVAAVPDDAGQVVALVKGAGVDRRAAVA